MVVDNHFSSDASPYHVNRPALLSSHPSWAQYLVAHLPYFAWAVKLRVSKRELTLFTRESANEILIRGSPIQHNYRNKKCRICFVSKRMCTFPFALSRTSKFCKFCFSSVVVRYKHLNVLDTQFLPANLQPQNWPLHTLYLLVIFA